MTPLMLKMVVVAAWCVVVLIGLVVVAGCYERKGPLHYPDAWMSEAPGPEEMAATVPRRWRRRLLS